MLERQIMFKQLQELQRQKKEQNEPKQQNVMDQHSLMHNKPTSKALYGQQSNGIAVRDPSSMFMFGDTKLINGVSGQLVFSQAQNQVRQPINSSSRHSRIQGLARKYSDLLTENKSLQPGTFGKSFIGDKINGSSNKDMVTLDPLEQKILFNTEDETTGSWSALMESAVAEASSSDGEVLLSFQKPVMPKGETDEALTRSHSNNSRAPYFGLRLTPKSQRPVVNCSDLSQISKQAASTHNQDYITKQSRPATFSFGGSGQQTFNSVVSVKKEGGQQWSTQPPNRWKDVHVKQNPSVICGLPSTSYAPNSRTRNAFSVKIAIKFEKEHYFQQIDGPDQNMAKSKKRKYPTYERLPWHKEMTQGCSWLRDMSAAELEWAHSVGRLPAKSKELVTEIEDPLYMVDHRKRRLNLTTQLMQLLFRPPAVILSEDATTHCDSVTYYAARLALGDACSSSGKNLTSEWSSDQDFSKSVDGLIDKSKRLQDELSRMEKKESTILEIRVDFQDLEKASVVNRFAKFHVRGELITGDTESSGVSSSKPKLYPQRYVKTSPMPDKIPDGQNCLSL